MALLPMPHVSLLPLCSACRRFLQRVRPWMSWVCSCESTTVLMGVPKRSSHFVFCTSHSCASFTCMPSEANTQRRLTKYWRWKALLLKTKPDFKPWETGDRDLRCMLSEGKHEKKKNNKVFFKYSVFRLRLIASSVSYAIGHMYPLLYVDGVIGTSVPHLQAVNEPLLRGIRQ